MHAFTIALYMVTWMHGSMMEQDLVGGFYKEVFNNLIIYNMYKL